MSLQTFLPNNKVKKVVCKVYKIFKILNIYKKINLNQIFLKLSNIAKILDMNSKVLFILLSLCNNLTIL